MTDKKNRTTAPMQGGGFYNSNSTLQGANLISAIPLLEDAARSIPIRHEQPIIVADYGSSQGRNSLLPMRRVIAALRWRLGIARPIQIFHTDLPTNDFASLFVTLDSDPQSYLTSAPNVFSYAVGRSYFDPILPKEQVDLGWSSNALHWMSSNPVDVADHGWAVFSASRDARNAVDQLLDEDWRRFLIARSSELRDGARLVCQFLGRGAARHGFEWMAHLFWQCIQDMERDAQVTAGELLRMTNPSAGRSIEQIRAPFQSGPFAGLALIQCSIVEAPDPFWDEYQKTGDAAAFGLSWAKLMRAANGPNFSAALDPGRSKDAFLDELSQRVATRAAAQPKRSESYSAFVVLEKSH